MLKVNEYGGRQAKGNEKRQCFKGWETLVTKYICVENYTPIGRAGRASSSGIQCKYKGEFIQLSATQTSETLYKIYGDSVVNHLKVRLIIKETLPHVYYMDKVLITYKK